MPKPFFFVGIDASLRATGYAFFRDDGELAGSGVIKPKTKMRGVERLAFLKAAILEALPVGPILTVIEDYAMGARGKTFHIGEWGGILRLALMETNRTSIYLLEPASLKQYATGHGGAQKDTMIGRARHLYGVEPKDDNEADALHLARAGYDFFHKTPLNAGHARGMKKMIEYYPAPYSADPVTARVRVRK